MNHLGRRITKKNAPSARIYSIYAVRRASPDRHDGGRALLLLINGLLRHTQNATAGAHLSVLHKWSRLPVRSRNCLNLHNIFCVRVCLECDAVKCVWVCACMGVHVGSLLILSKARCRRNVTDLSNPVYSEWLSILE